MGKKKCVDLYVLAAMALLLLVAGFSCESLDGESEWTATNRSSKELSVYHTDDPGRLYALPPSSTVTIGGKDGGGVYAKDMPFSVYQEDDWHDVYFYDKKKVTYTVLNRSAVVLVVTYYDEGGTLRTENVAFGVSVSVTTWEQSVSVRDADGNEVPSSLYVVSKE